MEQLATTEKYWRDWLALATIARPLVPAVHRAQRARAQGAQLRADRRDHGRRHDVAARVARWRAQLGLPLHVDPRHRVHVAGAARARLRVGGVRVLRVPARDDQRERGRRRRWQLQIMYGIGGETDLTEHTLDHLSGYRNSRPVRIGNGAFDQHQHDVWGMLLDSLAVHQRRGGQIPAAVWDGICSLRRSGHRRFPEPDQGIWEMRGEPQHFVASKVMCWVAVDRGLRLARVRDDDRARRAVAEGRRRHARRDPRQGRRRPRRVHAALRHQGPRRRRTS